MELFEPLGINLCGPAEDLSGIANVNRNILFTAYNMGVPIKWTPALEWWSHLKVDMSKTQWDILDELKKRQFPPGTYVTIFSFPPHYINDVDRSALFNISYSLFETDRIPMYGSHAWAPKLNDDKIMEVWVPCQFQRKSYKAGGVKPHKIRYVPMGTDVETFTPHGTRYRFTEGSEFKFLTIMDVSYRKGPDLLLKAYFEEFKETDDVILILKGYTGGADEGSKNTIRNMIKAAKEAAQSRAKVLYLGGFLKDSQLPKLHRSADVYVSASRGEGWALPVCQSMATGVPCIVPQHSAHLDYSTPQNSYLVPSDDIEITDKHWLANDSRFMEHHWWEPRLDELKKQMRHTYEHRDEVKAKGIQANLDIQKFSWQNTVINVVSQCGKFSQRREIKV